ncbi:MAG: hypothetical protein ACC645_04895, partial [Pirellulales bacterium]
EDFDRDGCTNLQELGSDPYEGGGRDPPNYWDFLALSERVNVAIMRTFEELGIRFALPQRVACTTIDGQQVPLEVSLQESRSADPNDSRTAPRAPDSEANDA